MTMNSGFGAIQTIREAKAKFFSNLDLQQAFHQLKLKDSKSREATSFTVRAGNALMENGSSPNGKWEMRVCSMGSAASSHALDRAVRKTFEGVGNVSTFADDIAVFSQSMITHLKHLEEVLDRIIKYGWLLNPGKSTFATNEINFLGFTISQQEVKPDIIKTKVLEDMEAPRTVPDIRRCLGIFGYFRDCIPAFLRLSNQLSKLLRKDTK